MAFTQRSHCRGIQGLEAGLIGLMVVTFGVPGLSATGWAVEELTEAHRASLYEIEASSAAQMERPNLQVALSERQLSLDRQIARVESHLKAARELHNLGGEPSRMVQKSSDPPMTSEENNSPDVPGNTQAAQNIPSSKDEIQVLDEIVVEGVPVDPFEEEPIEVVEDPWEPVNTRIFAFNVAVDRYVLKPLAMGYGWVVPDLVERAIGRALQNIRMVPRLVNNLLQGKMKGAGVEVGRFLINSTAGVAGFFDVAQTQFGLDPPVPEDTGQTLAVYGVKSGPYLVLPFLPPTTVRGGIGFVGDLLLDPLSYLLAFVPQASMRATEIVNDRSRNLELYEGVANMTVDLYGAVRGAYIQRRAKAILQ